MVTRAVFLRAGRRGARGSTTRTYALSEASFCSRGTLSSSPSRASARQAEARRAVVVAASGLKNLLSDHFALPDWRHRTHAAMSSRCGHSNRADLRASPDTRERPCQRAHARANTRRPFLPDAGKTAADGAWPASSAGRRRHTRRTAGHADGLGPAKCPAERAPCPRPPLPDSAGRDVDARFRRSRFQQERQGEGDRLLLQTGLTCGLERALTAAAIRFHAIQTNTRRLEGRGENGKGAFRLPQFQKTPPNGLFQVGVAGDLIEGEIGWKPAPPRAANHAVRRSPVCPALTWRNLRCAVCSQEPCADRPTPYKTDGRAPTQAARRAPVSATAYRVSGASASPRHFNLAGACCISSLNRASIVRSPLATGTTGEEGKAGVASAFPPVPPQQQREQQRQSERR